MIRRMTILMGLAAMSAASATAERAAAPRTGAVTAVEGITEHRLDNGLTVLLFPDPSKSTVTVNITYFVGSRHEGYGETGMAHLLEHMVFKGTPRHPKLWKSMEDHGAFFNGTTWVDRTNYFETLPATDVNLEFAIGLEADRMVNSRIAAEDLASEFSVVRNEFELGESYPSGVLKERMYSTAFLWHNYGKSTIGSREDIERVPVENLRAFYRKYYQPDNAMLVVAGKFDPARALALVRKHFGPIPRPSRKLTPSWTVEPVQDGERTVVLRRTGDVAVAGIMYHGLPGPHEDFAAQQAIMDILTNEPSGRLYKALVQTGMAARTYGYSFAWREPGVMECYADVRAGAPLEAVRDKMIEVVEGLAQGEVTQGEVDRYRAKALKELELAMTDSQGIAIALSEYAALGDWRMLFLTRDRIEKLTVAQVAKVAADFLKPSNRTVGLFVPTREPARTPLPPAVDVAAMVKGYQGRQGMSAGEDFSATIDHVEKVTVRDRLASGMKLAMVPRKSRGGAVEALLTIHYGSEKELSGRLGPSGMVAQMLLRGTRKRTHQQIKDELDRLKAEVTVFPSGVSASTLRIATVKDSLPEVLALVTEVLREPAFPADELEVLRKETLATLEEQLQDPISQGFQAINRRINPWPKDDVRHQATTAERIERVEAVKVEDVARAYAELWGGSHAEMTVLGDVDPPALKATLEKLLGDWSSPRPFERIATPYQAGVPTEAEVIRTPDKQSAMVAMGHGLELRDDDPDYPAMDMANYVLGSSAKSRLLDRLRQKDGLSYGAFSSVHADTRDRRGALTAGAFCAPQNAEKAVAAMKEEIEKLVREGVPAAELEDAKKSYRQVFDNQLAQDMGLLFMLNAGLHEDRTLAYYRDLNEKVAALTPDRVRQAIGKHLAMDRMITVMAGDLAAPSGGAAR